MVGCQERCCPTCSAIGSRERALITFAILLAGWLIAAAFVGPLDNTMTEMFVAIELGTALLSAVFCAARRRHYKFAKLGRRQVTAEQDPELRAAAHVNAKLEQRWADRCQSYTRCCCCAFTALAGAFFTYLYVSKPAHTEMADVYDITGCSALHEARCGRYEIVLDAEDEASAMCDEAPVYRKGGDLLYRWDFNGNSFWLVGTTARLNDCATNGYGWFLSSGYNPEAQSPTAPGYSGWRESLDVAAETSTMGAGDRYYQDAPSDFAVTAFEEE